MKQAKINILPKFHMGEWDGDIPRKDAPFYPGNNKYPAFLLNNSLYILSFLIPFIILLGYMIYFGFSPFGPNSMIIMDGTLTNLPLLQQTNATLHTGQYAFYQMAGKGTPELLSTWAFFFTSPFTLLTLLFDQSAAIPLLSIFNILRISMAGPLLLYFLTHRPLGRQGSKYDLSLLIFTIGYALSSFALFQHSDFMYMDHFMLFPLFLLGLEKLMAGGSRKLFCIISAACLFSQFNLGATMLLFALFYFLFRTDEPFPIALRQLGNLVLSGLIALGLSAVTVIPGFAGLSHILSDRCPNAVFVFSPLDLVLMQMFRHAPSFYTTSFSGSNVYCGLLVIFLAILHFTDKTFQIRKRIRDLLLWFILLLAITQSQIIYLSAMGHSVTSSFLPHAFLFVGLLLLYAFESLPNIRKQHVLWLLFALLLPFGLIVLAMKFSVGKPDFSSAQQSFGLLACFAVLLVLYRIGSIRRKTFYGLVVSITVLELCISAFFTMSFTAEEGELCEEITASSLSPADSASNGLGEIHKDRDGYLNSRYGLSSRYDVNPFTTATTLSHLSGETALRYDPLSDSMAGLKQLYLPQGSSPDLLPNETQYRKAGMSFDGSYDIYENDDAFPFFYTVLSTEQDYETMQKSCTDWAQSQNAITHFLGADPSAELFSHAKLKTELSSKDDLSIKHLGHNIFTATEPEGENAKDRYQVKIQFTPQESGDVYLYLDKPVHYGDAVAGDIEKYFYFFESSGFTDHTIWVQGYLFHPEILHDLSQKLCDNEIRQIDFHPFSFQITTDYPQDRYLISALPADNLFSVKLDGKKAAVCAVGDHQAVFLPAGQHKIEYSIPVLPLAAGLLITLLTLVLSHALAHFAALQARSAAIRLRAVSGKIADLITDNRIYLLSFFLPFFILLLAALFGSNTPFGYYSILNGDACSAEIPAVYDSVTLIRTGLISHFFQSGGGIVQSISNPAGFMRALYLLFPEEDYVNLITFLVLLRLSLCSFTLVWYLTHRSIKAPADKHDYKLLLAGLTYSLCNYMLIMMVYFSWLQTFVLLPLILWGMDELMVKKKKRAYIALLSLSFFLHYYMTMFICFYLVLRFFTYHFRSWKQFLSSGIRFALCSLATGALAFSILYQGLASLSGSTYGEKDATFTASYWFNGFPYLFQKQSVFADAAAVSWNEGDASLYFGLLQLMLLMIFILAKQIRISEKIRTLFPIVFLYITFNQSVLNFIFNGLHYQNGVPNRFAFLLPLCCAIVSYDAFRILPKQPKRKMLISVIAVFLLLGISDLHIYETPVSRLSLFATLGLLLIYGILMLTLQGSYQKRKLLPQLLLLFVIAEMSANAYFEFHANQANPAGITYEQEAVDMLNDKLDFDKSLDKVAVITPTNKNFGSVTKAFTMQLFAGGSITPYQIRMTDYSGMNPEANGMLVDCTNTLIGNAVAGNRYIVIHDRSTLQNAGDLKYYTPVAQTSHSIILKNDLCLPFGYYLPSSLSFSEEDRIRKSDFWDRLSETVTGETVMSAHDLPLFNPADPDQREYYSQEPIDTYSDTLAIHFVTPQDGDLYLNTEFFQYMDEVPKDAEVHFTSIRTRDGEADNLNGISYYLLDRDALDRLCEKINENAFVTESFDNNHVNGSIDMPEDGILNFSIPYTDQWNVFVDGQPAPAEPFAQAFLSVQVPKGHHSISLSYNLKFWTWPMTLTLLCWILFITACIISGHSRLFPRQIQKADQQ
ncbi:MAG: YfhO family protein [Lachnospiraceae bacterium]|nr:YfhO family protein [Lachnospiraceae bacterium]